MDISKMYMKDPTVNYTVFAALIQPGWKFTVKVWKYVHLRLCSPCPSTSHAHRDGSRTSIAYLCKCGHYSMIAHTNTHIFYIRNTIVSKKLSEILIAQKRIERSCAVEKILFVKFNSNMLSCRRNTFKQHKNQNREIFNNIQSKCRGSVFRV